MPSTLGIVASGVVFSPLDLSPVLWLDASDTSTITASGSPARVSQWDDKSGNGHHVTQASATPQPTTGATTINGRNVIDFTSARRLVRQNVTALQGVGSSTLYAVVNGNYSTAFGTLVSFTINNSVSVGRAWLWGNSNTLLAGGRRLDANSLQSVASASVTSNITYTVGGLFDYANADLKVRVNGASTTRSGGFQTAGNTSNTDSRLLVGANDGNQEPYSGSICEVVVTARILTADEISNLETYFADKWGI